MEDAKQLVKVLKSSSSLISFLTF